MGLAERFDRLRDLGPERDELDAILDARRARRPSDPYLNGQPEEKQGVAHIDTATIASRYAAHVLQLAVRVAEVWERPDWEFGDDSADEATFADRMQQLADALRNSNQEPSK